MIHDGHRRRRRPDRDITPIVPNNIGIVIDESD
jgi:hypothetical protein